MVSILDDIFSLRFERVKGQINFLLHRASEFVWMLINSHYLGHVIAELLLKL